MIEKRLDIIHKAICRAGFLIVTQIVKRKLTRAYLVEAVEQVKFATVEIERLIADTEKRSNTDEPNQHNLKEIME